jgi:ubiquinone/menaquinone biosynthesis C-methylase UbiE
MSDIATVFEDREIACLYDLFNLWTVSDDFYFERTTRRGGAVLDVGCGTGMLACRIAAAGLDVVGVDPAHSMLSVARTRKGGERVEWIRSKVENLDLERRFRTAYMTGHLFQALITDDVAVSSLRAVAAHLEPGGLVLFETRNPSRRAWERWMTGVPHARAEHPLLGVVVEIYRTEYDEDSGLARIEHEYRFEATGRVLRGTSQVRFRDQAHVTALVREAGLIVDVCLGDWAGAEFSPESEEIIIGASRGV